jgi:hypothetical protein
MKTSPVSHSRRGSRLAALLVVLLVSFTAQAQHYVQKTGTDNPFNGLAVDGGFPDLAAADLDGDGDFDLVAGNRFGNIQYFKNTGTPTAPAFTEQTGTNNPFGDINVSAYAGLTLGDLDADGDLDLLVGGNDRFIRFYRNTGTATEPTFTRETGLSGPFDTVLFSPTDPHPGLGDFDGDGDLDLLVGTSNGTTYYYKNDSTATVPDFQAADAILAGVSSPNVNDVNGDGLLDVTGVTYNQGVRYYQNIGTAQEPALQNQGNGPFAGLAVGFNPSVTIADLNGDGLGDAIIGERNGGINYFENTVPLAIAQQPTPDSVTVCQGGSASSTIKATGTNLSYQWYKGAASTTTGTLVAGQTGTTLSLTNVQPTDAGSYYARVSNADGVVWSTAFTLTVIPTTTIQSITPSQGTCPGVPFTLTVQAVGGNLTYQWYRVVNSALNQSVAGATSASLTLAAPASGSYFVVVTGSCGPSVTSQTVTLSPLPPTVLQVSSLVSSVCEGGSLTLSVRGSGPAPLTYAWRKDDPNGTIIGNGNSLTIQNAQPTDAGTYYATLTSACQSQTVSIPVTVRYLRITNQPQSVNLCSGTATLSVGVQTVGVGLTPTYQWKRNGQNIVGATQASYTVSASRPGTYSVEVKTACGSVTSNAATVGCSNGRLALESVEAPSLVVLPNPVSGSEIRCRVAGMESPEFSLFTPTGRSVSLRVKADGDYVLTPTERLGAGMYILEASQGQTRLTTRVLVAE